MTARPTCVLWTGGKDCFLAYLIAQLEYQTTPAETIFVTFVPPSGEFRCHPLAAMQAHAAHWDIPHKFLTIDQDDWQRGYRVAFEHLQATYGVERVLTGDIMYHGPALADYWMQKLLTDAGMRLSMPLAGRAGQELLALLDDHEIEVLVTGVQATHYSPDLLGRRLSLDLLGRLGYTANPRFDQSGEQGEYHTTVVGYRGHQFLTLDARALAHRRSGELWHLDFPRELVRLDAPRETVAAVTR